MEFGVFNHRLTEGFLPAGEFIQTDLEDVGGLDEQVQAGKMAAAFPPVIAAGGHTEQFGKDVFESDRMRSSSFYDHHRNSH